MQYEIEDTDLRQLLESGDSKKYKALARNKAFMKGLRRVFSTFDSAVNVDVLFLFSFLHYERLKNNMAGFSSCRILNSSPMRLLIREREDKLFITILTMEDYHL